MVENTSLRELNIQKCNEAIDEIMNFGTEIVPKFFYCSWLNQHSELIANYELPPIYNKTLYRFYTLYHLLEDFVELLNFEDEATKIIDHYNKLEIINETELLKWLVVNEKYLYFMFSYDCFISEENLKTSQIKLSKEFNVLIDTKDYKNGIQFKTLFDKNYWSMLDKYTTLSDDDRTKLISGTEEYENQISLKYYLKKREII